ncbi:ABC transporter permease [Stella sp.]|uniref:ABC transporter permease n=1 Tax=Stella sp. TaxID=2912054 RepID=UPI0035AFAB32
MADRLSRLARTHEFRLLAAVLALSAGLAVASDGFLTAQNLFDLLTANAFAGILAAGLLVVLVAGGIDISFTATASVAQYVAMSAANAWGLDWLSVFAIGMATGTALGLVNGTLVERLRIPGIIVTIATLNVFYGLLVFQTGGRYIHALPDWFAAGIWWFEYVDADQIPYAVNLQILLLVLALAATAVLLGATSLGRQVRALGGNREAARRVGFPVSGLTLFVYGWMGMMAGLASLAQAQLAQSVAPTVLVGRELDVLAAVVLGGASLTGGVGSVTGTVLGLALLAIMQNGLVLAGVSSYWSPFFTGLVILVAVVAGAMGRRAPSGAAA